ncbi:MAG: helix-turn-helix transcriptional regulator [Bacillota bacterium]|nr:helix-turn-helix transcriptional regulator [Bacillota bacterium]
MFAFAQVVRRARLAKGLSQGRLARAIGVTPQYISDIERGKAMGSYRTVRRLAEVFPQTGGHIQDRYCRLYQFKNSSIETPISLAILSTRVGGNLRVLPCLLCTVNGFPSRRKPTHLLL